MAYQVKIDLFEGPFDLLLHLISKKEIDIYEISVSEITRDYLDYLETMRSLDLEIATEFLLIAATLVKLKSDGLLPSPERDITDVAPYDSRDELIWRLVEYKKFKNAAEELYKYICSEDRYYYREVELEEPYRDIMPDLLERLTLDQLVKRARELILGFKVVDISHIAPIRINVRDYMERVLTVLTTQDSISFVELTNDCASKLEIIAYFLALLELYKWEAVDLRQKGRFGEIYIYRNKELSKEDLISVLQEFDHKPE